MELYEEKYSLYVGLNFNDGGDGKDGLRQLLMPNLHGECLSYRNFW